MAYTIKGLARANQCARLDEYGLADMWQTWYVCNHGGRKSIITDFKSLRKEDRRQMVGFLRTEPFYSELYNHIINNIF